MIVDINEANIGAAGNLTLGFYGGTVVGSGVTGVTVTLTDGGSTDLINQSFASTSAALNYFTDHGIVDLLPLAATNGVLSLDLTITLTTDQAGSGIYTGFIVGKAGSGSLTDQRPVATGSVARGLIDNHASMAHGVF